MVATQPSLYTEAHHAIFSQAGPRSDAVGEVTTYMFRDLPRRFTANDLTTELERHCARTAFDFVYVPWDKNSTNNMGFAFVNFVDMPTARMIYAVMEGRFWQAEKPRKIAIVPARVQGLAMNLIRYCDGSTEAPDFAHSPLVFSKGTSVPLMVAMEIVLKPGATASGNTQIASAYAAMVSPPPGLSLLGWQDKDDTSSMASTTDAFQRSISQESSLPPSPGTSQGMPQGFAEDFDVLLRMQDLVRDALFGHKEHEEQRANADPSGPITSRAVGGLEVLAPADHDELREVLASPGYAKAWHEVDALLHKLRQARVV